MAGKVSDFDRWIRTINEPRGSGPGTPATHTVHLTVMQFTPHVGWCVFQERLLLVFRLVPALDWNGTRVVVGLVVCACAARLVSWQKKKKIELDRSVECLRINGNPIWGIDFFIPSRPLAEVGWWVRGTARGRRNNSEHTHTHKKKRRCRSLFVYKTFLRHRPRTWTTTTAWPGSAIERHRAHHPPIVDRPLIQVLGRLSTYKNFRGKTEKKERQTEREREREREDTLNTGRDGSTTRSTRSTRCGGNP